MSAPDFRSIRPRTLPATPVGQEAVRYHPLDDDQPLPLVIEPEAGRLELADWAAANRERIDALLDQHGVLLFRGFAVDPANGFARFSAAVGSGPLQYTQRSTRRVQAGEGVYTSTEYPATHSITLHSENAFQYQWPQRIMFHSVTPAATGGATPLADNVAVYDAIPAGIRDELVARRILYVRNFGAGLELPWQEAFQTQDQAEVEAYCRRVGSGWTWKGGDRLKTTQVLPAAIFLPAVGRPAWFNQGHLFHISNLAPPVREALLEAVPEDDLPRQAYYGDDGSPIPDEHFDAVRAAYDACTVRFPWQRDDVSLVHNLRVCHGRDPFTGDRRVLVSMSDPADYGTFEHVPTGRRPAGSATVGQP